MPAPPTLSISLNSLATLLAQRLGIVSATDFWSIPELVTYLRQAIREFQVLTGFWRSSAQLQAAASTTWYDLSAATPTCAYTVLDTDILAQVGYQLLEYSGTQAAFINTQQFSIAQASAALDQRREEILGDTRMVVTDYQPPPFASAPQGRIALANSIIQIHRVDWQDQPSSQWGVIERTDEIQAYGFSYAWPLYSTGALGYSTGVTPPFNLQFIPAPQNGGQLDILATICDPYAFVAGSPVKLGIPDDSTWALAWGVLASMLTQDAQSRDYMRADYALQRFRSALAILKVWPCVLQAKINNLPVQPSPMNAVDNWMPNWRNMAPTTPQAIGVAGRNLLALAPMAPGPQNIALDLIGNSPASLGQYVTLQIPGDIVTALLDNAQHLACFKEGGEEFAATMPLYRNFVNVAEKYVMRQMAEAIDFEALRATTMIENADAPYEVQPEEEAVA
jgi:hypothetical protein